MADFDQMNPSKKVTDPDPNNPKEAAARDKAYPKTLYKAASEPGSTTLVVGWKGNDPIHNEAKTVQNAEDEAAAVKDGFGADCVTDIAPAVVEDAEPVKKSKKS